MRSARRPTNTKAPGARGVAAAPGPGDLLAADRDRGALAVERREAPSRMFSTPMKSATKRLAGRSNSARGGPAWAILPRRIRITRSLIVSASSWEWVM